MDPQGYVVDVCQVLRWERNSYFVNHRRLNNVKFFWDGQQRAIASRINTGGEPGATY
jgi:hypothetical protein